MFSELAIELPCVRRVEKWSFVLQEIDVEGGAPERRVVEAYEPGGHLRLDFYLTPTHSTDAIICP